MAKQQTNIPSKIVFHIKATFNNTKIYAYDQNGGLLAQTTGGVTQRGARKSSGPNAEDIGKRLGNQLVARGAVEAVVYLDGYGNGRESSVKGLSIGGIKVTKLVENTPDAHNGVRRKKKKRN